VTATGQRYQGFPKPEAPAVDPESGLLTFVWYRFLANLWKQTGGSNIPIAAGVVFAQVGAYVVAQLAATGAAIGTLLTNSSPGGSAQAQSPATSPWVFVAPQSGTLVVASGQVEYGRGGKYYLVGLTGGAIWLLAGDSVRVTWYAAVPTVVWLPSN
jgi:hypothetical protein